MNPFQRIWFRTVSHLASIGNLCAPETVNAFVQPSQDWYFELPPCPRGKLVHLPSGGRVFVAIEVLPEPGSAASYSSDLFQDIKHSWTPDALKAAIANRRTSCVAYLGKMCFPVDWWMGFELGFELGPLQRASLKRNGKQTNRRRRTVTK